MWRVLFFEYSSQIFREVTLFKICIRNQGGMQWKYISNRSSNHFEFINFSWRFIGQLMQIQWIFSDYLPEMHRTSIGNMPILTWNSTRNEFEILRINQISLRNVSSLHRKPIGNMMNTLWKYYEKNTSKNKKTLL